MDDIADVILILNAFSFQAWSDNNDLYKIMDTKYTLLDNDETLFKALQEANAVSEQLKAGAIQRVLRKMTVSATASRASRTCFSMLASTKNAVQVLLLTTCREQLPGRMS